MIIIKQTVRLTITVDLAYTVNTEKAPAIALSLLFIVYLLIYLYIGLTYILTRFYSYRANE